MTIPANLGLLLLGIWLILYGVLPYVPALASINPLMHVLAIIAGVLLLMKR